MERRNALKAMAATEFALHSFADFATGKTLKIKTPYVEQY